MVSCAAKTRNKENIPATDKSWDEAQRQKPAKLAVSVRGMTTEMAA